MSKQFQEDIRIAQEKFPQVKVLDIFFKEAKEKNRTRKIKWIKVSCEEHGICEKRYYDYLKAKYPCKKCSNKAKHFENISTKSLEEFIEKANKVHNNLYDYSKVKFEDPNKEVEIICPKHGSFFQTPNNHYNHGCKKCSVEKMIEVNKLSTQEVVEKCIKIRGVENYDYSLVKWSSGETENIDIICKKHGVFNVRYFDFIKGVDCKICAKKKQAKAISEKLKGRIKITEKEQKGFIEKAKKIRPFFDYSKTVYTGKDKSVIITFKGKDYTINATNLLKGSLPIELSIARRAKQKKINRWKNIEEELKILHNNKYEYLKEEINFIKSGNAERNYIMHIMCKKHGIFTQAFFDHRCGSGCKKCAIENRPIINISKAEKDIVDFIKSIYNGQIITNDRTILGGKELDIYFPELKLAIEYDGLFWHNNIDNSYKFEECRKQGIRLIRIIEPEWVKQEYKIKVFLKSTFGIFDKKIFARKCEVKEIDNENYKLFTEENHLQGYVVASVKIGLFYENQLVQVMSFGKPRFNNKTEWELIRECSKLGYSIIGGKEKLLKFFEKRYNPKNILSYCEKDKFSGRSYYKNGFKLIRESKPNYVYFYKKDYTPLSRIGFQKYKLKDKLEEFDENLTEWENMLNNGYRRMFDYGNYVFVKELINENS